MAFFNEFPHTRTYDDDLGWLIAQIKKIIDKLTSVSETTASNNSDLKWLKSQIEYILDQLQQPIETWSAANAYSAYTLVEYMGGVYMAIKDVPVGVGIGDTEYWVPSGDVLTIITQMQLDLNNQRADISKIKEVYNVISVKDYGAVGDGETNDHDAIESAAAEATRLSLPLIFETGKSYYIQGTSIPVDTDINFNGSEIIMSDDSSVCFTIGSTGPSQTIDMSTANTHSIGSGNSDLFDKGFYLVTDVPMGNRGGGSGTYYYYAQYLKTDVNGYFLNSDLEVGYGSNHTATAYNIIDFKIEPIKIENGTVKYQSTSTESRPFMDIFRPRVSIENIIVDSPIVSTTLQSYVFRVTQTCDISFKHIDGTNVSLDASHSSYIMLISGCSDILIEDTDISQGWGNTGLTFVTNVVCNRVHSNRLDIHYGHNGYITFNNCVCAGNLGVASIGMGYASITFNNCLWIGSDAESQSWCVMFRNDYGIPARQVIFNNCTFRHRGVNTVVFQVNRPATQEEASNFDATIPFMDIVFNHCDSNCLYWFSTTLNNDIVTPKINLYLNDYTQMYNRRICSNLQPINSLIITGMNTTGSGLLHNQSIITTAANIVRISNSRINLAFGSGGVYDLIITGCYIVASSGSSINGGAVIVGNIFANGVTDRLTAAKGKESSGNVTLTA